ncbi:glutathione synthase [Bartonella sp. DGB1]|uniref:glutathione synthase n=1 Tax=Bartonella sp. DGB1 TaxID=3239807 RepID=UPI00352544AE
MKIALQMDHISTIDKTTDTTFALGLEAYNRGYNLFHYTPADLFMKNTQVFARVQSLELDDDSKIYYKLGDKQIVPLSDMQVILLRQDPPFNMRYITTTHLLEKLPATTLVINNPFWVRNCPEKIFVTEFPDLIPPTLISEDIEEIKKFRNEYGEIILKPLYGNGGAGVFYLKADDKNLMSLTEIFALLYNEPVIVQKYIPEVIEGDKRILLVDGEVVGAINRVASEEEVRSNLHVGGKALSYQLTERDREICERIKPFLKEKGFFFVGIDVIGKYITEINVTSPTGIRSFKTLGGQDIAKILWDKLEEKLTNIVM